MRQGLIRIIGRVLLNLRQAGSWISMSTMVIHPTGCLMSRRRIRSKVHLYGVKGMYWQKDTLRPTSGSERILFVEQTNYPFSEKEKRIAISCVF